MNTIILVILQVILLGSEKGYATQECEGLMTASPSAFTDSSQHADCDYTSPTQTPATDAEHQNDLYWITEVHSYALRYMPTFPYGAALVDNRTNDLVAIGTNMFHSDDPWYSQISISHAETVVITNATITTYPDIFNYTTGRRQVDPSWQYLTLYGNIEPCPMCAQAAIWRGLNKMVFGARQSQLYAQRCWVEPSLSAYEVVDHSSSYAPFSIVRGPMAELEDSIIQSFAQLCA